MPKIEELISKFDRYILKEPEKLTQRSEAIRMTGDLVILLEGNYHRTVEILPAPREASTYFQGEACSRGCCRHKAIVLASVLRHYGIRAQLQIGKIADDYHMWVYLPDFDLVADPTSGTLETRAHYLKTALKGNDKHIVTLGYDWNNWTLTPIERGWFR
jgi:hypothetical protein